MAKTKDSGYISGTIEEWREIMRQAKIIRQRRRAGKVTRAKFRNNPPILEARWVPFVEKSRRG